MIICDTTLTVGGDLGLESLKFETNYIYIWTTKDHEMSHQCRLLGEFHVGLFIDPEPIHCCVHCHLCESWMASDIKIWVMAV